MLQRSARASQRQIVGLRLVEQEIGARGAATRHTDGLKYDSDSQQQNAIGVFLH